MSRIQILIQRLTLLQLELENEGYEPGNTAYDAITEALAALHGDARRKRNAERQTQNQGGSPP